MKRLLSLLLPMLLCAAAYGQGMFGASAGLGIPTGFKNKNTLTGEVYYLHKITQRLYIGATAMYQRYSLMQNFDVQTNNYGDILDVRQKSTYIYLSPKADFGIGYRKYLHVFASAGIGFYAGGKQYSDTHVPYWTPPGGVPYGSDTIGVNTSYNIPSVLPRFGFGFMERIPTHRYWHITLMQEFSLLAGNASEGNPPMKINYISFGIGIMHKYPMVRVDY